MRIARSLGIPVPKTFSDQEVKEKGIGGAGFKFPVLIKPYQGGGAWGISHIEDAGMLENILSEETYLGRPWDRFFVQEKIEGTVHCVAMLLNNGTLKGHVVYRQLRDFPFTGGQATIRVSIDDPVAVDYFQKTARKTFLARNMPG